VGGYSAWANADGNPLTKAQSDAISKQADGLVSFISLFRQMGASGKAPNANDKDIYAINGARIDPTQDPGSAVGFLSFAKRAGCRERSRPGKNTSWRSLCAWYARGILADSFRRL
jgi:hypothetical protein